MNGVRVQAIPMLRYHSPSVPVSFYAGVGLGGRGSITRRWGYDSDRRHLRDVASAGADQTFLLGLAFELSRRFDVNVEAERAGFSVSYEVVKTYMWYSGYGDPLQDDRDDHLNVGWLRSAPTGIGVGLRLKL